MPETDATDPLRADLRAAWHRFVDALVPVRPVLHAHCRRLTGSIWDAEDLAQETLLRAFGQWGVTYPGIRDPRVYLLRTATNIWIDDARRRETARRAAALETAAAPPAAEAMPRSMALRDAGDILLRYLSPQEQAALVLKESFDMTLDEIAALLATTTGAVKAALHRGRDRLRATREGAVPHRPRPSAALLDRFVARYEAGDVQGLIDLMLDGGTAENVGNSLHVGATAADLRPFFEKVVHGHAEWPARFRPDATRLQRAEVEGEPVLLSLATRRGREALEVVFRFEEQDGRIRHLRAYGFCPETIRAVGELLGLPVVTGIYRAPTPAPGADWPAG